MVFRRTHVLITHFSFSFILKAYIDYYNSKQPHQGLEQHIPQGFVVQNTEKLEKLPFLADYVIILNGCAA